ncbi:hypothetical protein HDZ31DRAFT_42390 [Schizophyllum fasciatum]
MSAPRARADEGTRKRKKRACDYCRLKRVICHPQPNGKSCPRCEEKGIRCTTTVTQKVQQDSDDDTSVNIGSSMDATKNNSGAESPVSASMYTVPLRRAPPSSPSNPPIISQAIPGKLVQDALHVCETMMPVAYALLRLQRHKKALERCDWDLQLLAPQERVFTLCLLAMASLVSVHPVYVGHDAQGDPYLEAHLEYEKVASVRMDTPEMRDFGRRRKTLSSQLYGEAVRHAHQDGICSSASPENAASCYLLNILDVTHVPESTMPWATAFVWQLRTLNENRVIESSFDIGTDTVSRHIASSQWRGTLLLTSIHAIKGGKTLPFSKHDEILICGPDPPSVDDAFVKATVLTHDLGSMIIMRSVTARNVEIIRGALENVVGAFALQNAFDDMAAVQQVAIAERAQADYVRLRHLLRGSEASHHILCLFGASLVICVVSIALRRVILRRAADSASSVARVRTLAVRAVMDVVESSSRMIAPHLLGFNQANGFEEWATVLLDADEDLISAEDRISAFERCVHDVVNDALSLTFAASPRLRELILFSSFIGLERLEALPAIDAELQNLRTKMAAHMDSSQSDAFVLATGYSPMLSSEAPLGSVPPMAPLPTDPVRVDADTPFAEIMQGGQSGAPLWKAANSQLPDAATLTSSEIGIPHVVPTDTDALHLASATTLDGADPLNWEQWVQPDVH